jgi:glycosyltransferase domain-containing protein
MHYKSTKKKYDITIVLTIYNRVSFTINWLNFAEEQKIPFDIIISDGGNIKNIQNELNLKNRKLNIRYKKFKFYRNYIKIHEKYYEVLKYVKTKYIIFAEDDDYINYKGYIKSANFLKKNKKFSSVKGKSILGELSPQSSFFNYFVLRKENKNFNSFKILNKNHDERLLNFVKYPQVSLWNGLHRVSNMKIVFKILNRNFYNLHATEKIFQFMVVSFGKIKFLNIIDYVKIDNTEFSSSFNFEKFLPFKTLVKSKKYYYENYFYIKYLKLRKKYKEFIYYYNKNFEESKRVRLIDESSKNKLIYKLINLIRLITEKLNVKYILKFIIYSFKYKTISKGIFLKENNLFFTRNDQLFLKKIYDFNAL